MHKKFMLACMAVAAFAAIVVAPAASASPVLTSGTGGPVVPIGTSIVWLHTGNIEFTGSVTIDCSNARLTGTVTKNSGSQIKAEIPKGSASITGTGTGGDCTSTLFGSPAKVTVNSKLCFETVEGTDNAKFSGCGANISYTIELTGNGPCKYESASSTGTFKTSEHATFTVLDQVDTLVEGGFFCPSSLKTDYDLDAVTTDLTPLVVS